MPQILGLSPHSYYHNPRNVLHPDNGLAPGMSSCQRLSSSLPNQDARFQQQSPTIVYSRGGKSLSGSPSLYQQPGGMIPDPHRSVLVHTGSPAQPGGPLGSGQHPSIIQFSPTNHHLLRAGDAHALPPPQPDSQQIIYCDGYSPQAGAAHSPTPPQAQTGVSPQHYPTVIQQQPYVQKGPQKGREQQGEGQMEASGDGQRRVTVKEENLDQAYLDDGECKFMLSYSVCVHEYYSTVFFSLIVHQTATLKLIFTSQWLWECDLVSYPSVSISEVTDDRKTSDGYTLFLSLKMDDKPRE